MILSCTWMSSLAVGGSEKLMLSGETLGGFSAVVGGGHRGEFGHIHCG